MHIWNQNLKKDDIESCGTSSTWFNRRGTVSNANWDAGKQETWELGWQIHVDKRLKLGTEFSCSKAYVSEHTLAFNVRFLFFSIYLHLTSQWLENKKWYGKILKEDETVVEYSWGKGMKQHATEHSVSFSVYDKFVMWKLWAPDDWNRSIPKWRNGGLELCDLFLGKLSVNNVTLHEEDVKVPMSEKEYDAHVKIYSHQRKRSRWPFVKRILRGQIECEEGIPHPGKGTCGYNCGDDRTYSINKPVTNKGRGVSELIGSMVSSVSYYRDKYPL